MRRVLAACAPASVRLTVGADDRQVRPPSGLTSRQPTVLLTYLSLFVRIYPSARLPVYPSRYLLTAFARYTIHPLSFNIFLPSSDALPKTTSACTCYIIRRFVSFSSLRSICFHVHQL